MRTDGGPFSFDPHFRRQVTMPPLFARMDHQIDRDPPRPTPTRVEASRHGPRKASQGLIDRVPEIAPRPASGSSGPFSAREPPPPCLGGPSTTTSSRAPGGVAPEVVGNRGQARASQARVLRRCRPSPRPKPPFEPDSAFFRPTREKSDSDHWPLGEPGSASICLAASAPGPQRDIEHLVSGRGGRPSAAARLPILLPCSEPASNENAHFCRYPARDYLQIV